MNDYEGSLNSVDFIKDEEFLGDIAEEMLTEFVEYATPLMKLDSPNAGDIVLGLSRLTPFVDTYKGKLPKKVREAVIVDFVNYVGVCCGIDLAMYTSDIASEREKS